MDTGSGGSGGMPGGGSGGTPGSGSAGMPGSGGSTGMPGGGGTGHAGTSAMTNPGTPAGNVSSIMVGSLVVVSGSFILGRDAQGLYAMSIRCTHQGCSVTPSGSALYCPCHGSRFDSNGAVLQGPARTPLPHYAVLVDAAGNITVQTTMVDASTRTAVA
jgi:Rieske Fe-S protein